MLERGRPRGTLRGAMRPRRPSQTSPTASREKTASSTGSSAWGQCSPATTRSSWGRSLGSRGQ
eukprot:11170469-Alexandrium_andersonii.AAC.1